jgi:hypothetical protein
MNREHMRKSFHLTCITNAELIIGRKSNNHKTDMYLL